MLESRLLFQDQPRPESRHLGECVNVRTCEYMRVGECVCVCVCVCECVCVCVCARVCTNKGRARRCSDMEIRSSALLQVNAAFVPRAYNHRYTHTHTPIYLLYILCWYVRESDSSSSSKDCHRECYAKNEHTPR